MASDTPLFNHFPNNTVLDHSKLKDFADDNLKFDGRGGKFSKRVENTVGKEKLLVFPQCFQKTCTADT